MKKMISEVGEVMYNKDGIIKENYDKEDIEIIRDLYLRTYLTGERLGPLTGKPSIDRPWLINYSEEEIATRIPKRRLYRDLIESSKNNLSNIAIEYYGNKITYEELIKNIEITASSLKIKGIKKGDVVSVSMPYLPETIYTIYALNKIGAIVNMIDPRINDDLIFDYMKNANSRNIIMIDKIESKINNLILRGLELDNVISVSPTNSMGNIILRKIGKHKKNKYNFIKWNKFFNPDGDYVKEEPFEENALAVIEYTSGTSGKPKGVKLSNETFNALSYFQKQSLLNEVGDKFLLIMPPFIAYGLVIGMHNMLCQGQHLLMIPSFTLDKAPKMLGKLINKYHPNYIMGVPNFLLVLMKYKKNLSFLKGIIIGGDHLDKEIEKRAREYLKNHDSNAKVLKGWGMTEIASCGTFTKNDVKNNLGSVGIPLSKNVVKVLPRKNDENVRYNIDDEELYYNEEGILFISSPSMTLGYFKNEEASNKIIYTDKDGNKWVNTGDIFKISNDGSLYFCGREKRVVVRPDGHNIPSNQIESIASLHYNVETAVVVGTKSRKYAHGSVATLCIVLKDNNLDLTTKENILSEIENKCRESLQPRDRAKYYFILDSIPYAMNGKIDYRLLTDYVNELIDKSNIDEDTRKSFYLVDQNILSHDKVRKKVIMKG